MVVVKRELLVGGLWDFFYRTWFPESVFTWHPPTKNLLLMKNLVARKEFVIFHLRISKRGCNKCLYVYSFTCFTLDVCILFGVTLLASFVFCTQSIMVVGSI